MNDIIAILEICFLFLVLPILLVYFTINMIEEWKMEKKWSTASPEDLGHTLKKSEISQYLLKN